MLKIRYGVEDEENGGMAVRECLVKSVAEFVKTYGKTGEDEYRIIPIISIENAK